MNIKHITSIRGNKLEEIKISGNWKIEKDEYKGELHIVKSKKIIRLVIQSQKLERFFNDEEFPDNMDLIHGVSFLNNNNISLLNCRTLRKNTNLNTGITTFLIDCKYCIYGLKFESYEGATFNKLQVRLTNSMEWSTLSGFSSKRGKKKKIEEIEYKFKKKISYNINENIKLEIVPWFGGGTFYLNSEKVVLKQHITINLRCNKLEKFEKLVQELKKVIALIEFSTKLKVDIVEIKGFKNSKFYKYPNIRKRKYIDYRIYYANEIDIKNENDEIEKIDRNFNCNLKQIYDVNGLKNWFEKYENLKPIIDLYRKNIENFEYYDEIPEEEIFINIIKSLEFYHTIFMVESLEDYKKILSNKLDNILQENKELVEAFIYDNAQENADYILLKNRLIHLFFEEMPIYYFEKLEYILNFINSITDTRHYYTHYNKSKKYKAMKGVELSISTIILQTLLESCIFKELGFTKDFINNHKREAFSQLKKYEIPKREEKYIKLYKKVHLITSIENILKIVINEYNIGDYTSYHVIEDNADEDLYVEIITKTNKKYRIRILSENKNDEECEEIIKNDKRKLLYTKKKFYSLYYFYGKYRILIYKSN
ncbi:putative uncharacterized protein [Clostridium sp. CAG:571]|nr:putative uncharacterized protein [Clostridium sp. CAG:571]